LGAEVKLHIVMSSAVGGGEWSASFFECFMPVEIPSIHWIGG